MALSEDRFDDLLDRWEAAWHEGRYLSATELCADQPEYANTLRERIAALVNFERFDSSCTAGGSRQKHPEHIGGYKVEAEIARGGMGVVYRCRQETPRRLVAVKVLRQERLTATSLARFEREIDVLAMLNHPGIAKVFDAGISDLGCGPQPFLVMEFIDGTPLLAYATEASLDASERVELMVAVSEALDHVHKLGIIHRDINPSNILVEKSGRPRILDFGIARIQITGGSSPSLTTHRGLVGTLPYMSPEQVDGEQTDARSDIYSLGVVLFQLLSGRLPLELQRKSVPKAIQAIHEDRVPLLGEIDKAFSRDLETVVDKALAKVPTDRYATAGELAEDLVRYTRGLPVRARPLGRGALLRRWANRHPAVATLGLAIVMLLTVGIALTSLLAIRASDAAKKTQSALTALQSTRLDQGFARAFTGDVEGVTGIAEDAELDGEWQAVLKGSAQFFGGDFQAAIDTIQPFANDDENIAALALLGMVYRFTPDWTNYEQIYPRLHSASPRPSHRDFDQVLLTLAKGGRDFDLSMEQLQSILQGRKWVMPKLLVECMSATPSFETEQQVETSIRKSESVTELFPDNLFFKGQHLEVLLLAAEHCRRNNLPVKDILTKALSAASQLDGYPIHCQSRSHLFDIAGQQEKAKAEWIQLAHSATPTVVLDAVGYLYLIGDEIGAWQIIDSRSTNTPEEKVAMAYMLLDDRDRRSDVVELCDEALAECPTMWILQMTSKALLLIGEVERARTMCQQWKSTVPPSTNVNPWVWIDKLSIQFLGGEIDRDAYRRSDESSTGKLFYHLNIGCLEIGCGNREKAEEHLELAVHHCSFYAPESNWARAFLKRFRADPQWPRGHRRSAGLKSPM